MKQLIALIVALAVLIFVLVATGCTICNKQAWPKQPCLPCPPDDILMKNHLGCITWIPKGYIDTIPECDDCNKDDGI